MESTLSIALDSASLTMLSIWSNPKRGSELWTRHLSDCRQANPQPMPLLHSSDSCPPEFLRSPNCAKRAAQSVLLLLLGMHWHPKFVEQTQDHPRPPECLVIFSYWWRKCVCVDIAVAGHFDIFEIKAWIASPLAGKFALIGRQRANLGQRFYWKEVVDSTCDQLVQF